MNCERETCRLLSPANVVVTHEVTRGDIVEGHIEHHFHTSCADKYLKLCEEQLKELSK